MASPVCCDDILAIANWELLFTALHRDHSSSSRLDSSATVGGSVPSSLGQSSNIDSILEVANEIQSQDPGVARILCEHAYTLSHSLDPNSEGREVLQFKTGLMSAIKKKLASGSDRTQDVVQLEAFYKHYRKQNKLDVLQERETLWREGKLTLCQKELQRESFARRKIYATLAVLRQVVNAHSGGRLSPEFQQMMQVDVAKTEEFKAFHILPFDAPRI